MSANSPAVANGLTLPFARADYLDQCYAAIPTIGAFEAMPIASDLDSDGDGLPDYWELTHEFNWKDPLDSAQDADGDGLSNYGEFLVGTEPRDAASRFQLNVVPRGAGSMVLRFQTRLGNVYTVQSRALTSESWADAALIPGRGAQEEHRATQGEGLGRLFRIKIERTPQP